MSVSLPDSVPVPLEGIEGALCRAFSCLEKRDAPPRQRTRLSNLIIFCDSAEQARAVDALLPEVVGFHPARILLLTGEPGPDLRQPSASVKVRPVELGQGRQGFCEQINLHAGGAVVDRFPFAVRSLLVGDIPTNLWWAAHTPPPLAGPLVMELVELCQQVVYDSVGWPDPVRGVSATAAWLEQVLLSAGPHWRVVSDLNWRRLKYWRRLLAQATDPASAPGAISTVGEVLIEHGPHAVVQAWLLASWLTRLAGWRLEGGKVQPGAELAWRFARRDGGTTGVRIHRLEEGPPRIERIRVQCLLDGRPATLVLSTVNEHRLSITIEGAEAAPRTLSLPPYELSELVGRQLCDRERDPVFREIMAIARAMAQSVLGFHH